MFFALLIQQFRHQFLAKLGYRCLHLRPNEHDSLKRLDTPNSVLREDSEHEHHEQVLRLPAAGQMEAGITEVPAAPIHVSTVTPRINPGVMSRVKKDLLRMTNSRCCSGRLPSDSRASDQR